MMRDLVGHRAQEKPLRPGHALVADDYQVCALLLGDVQDRVGGISAARIDVGAHPVLVRQGDDGVERRADVLTAVDRPLQILWGVATLVLQTRLGHGLIGAHDLQLRADRTREFNGLTHRLRRSVRAVGTNHDRFEHVPPCMCRDGTRRGLGAKDVVEGRAHDVEPLGSYLRVRQQSPCPA